MTVNAFSLLPGDTHINDNNKLSIKTVSALIRWEFISYKL